MEVSGLIYAFSLGVSFYFLVRWVSNGCNFKDSEFIPIFLILIPYLLISGTGKLFIARLAILTLAVLYLLLRKHLHLAIPNVGEYKAIILIGFVILFCDISLVKFVGDDIVSFNALIATYLLIVSILCSRFVNIKTLYKELINGVWRVNIYKLLLLALMFISLAILVLVNLFLEEESIGLIYCALFFFVLFITVCWVYNPLLFYTKGATVNKEYRLADNKGVIEDGVVAVSNINERVWRGIPADINLEIANTSIIDDAKIIQNIINLFEQEKLYRNADVTIGNVAMRIGTNKTYLSRALNRRLSKNFCQFVNRYRVKEACMLYINDISLDLKDVLFKCGFNSSSNFSIVFKYNTGFTPSDWCREVRERIERGEEVAVDDYLY